MQIEKEREKVGSLLEESIKRGLDNIVSLSIILPIKLLTRLRAGAPFVLPCHVGYLKLESK